MTALSLSEVVRLLRGRDLLAGLSDAGALAVCLGRLREAERHTSEKILIADEQGLLHIGVAAFLDLAVEIEVDEACAFGAARRRAAG